MSNFNTTPDPYQFLDRISTEELQRLLREDFKSEDEGTVEHDEFITKVMEVIAKREESEPSVPTIDPAAGWEDFQKNYYPTEEDPVLLCDDAQLKSLNQKYRVVKSVPQSSAPGRIRSFQRVAVVVAAAIGIFMSGLVVAQAAGLDVFGAMARWTDETFHFVITPTTNHEVEAFCSALDEYDISTEYAPTWLPEGFVADEPEVTKTKRLLAVSARFKNSKNEIIFTVTKYDSEDVIYFSSYEKEVGEAIPYMNGKQLFYIFENTNSTTAAWSDGDTLTINICGQISTDDMKSIIDSIGG